MRGKVRPYEKQRNRYGITPAYAGKSSTAYQRAVEDMDHPRVCGEKLKFIAAVFSMWGSPPRMRGKALFFITFFRCYGITPAYAGKSYHARYMVIVIRDHPRVCGEKRRFLCMSVANVGSPPRMRGKD